MKTIMIVDDENDILTLASTTLSLQGYNTVQVTSGKECLRLLETGVKPDLILLDIMMPEMDGYAVCKKIKSDEKFKNIVVVMLSAKTQNRNVVDGYKSGADGYITKPFDPTKLVSEIKIYLGIV